MTDPFTVLIMAAGQGTRMRSDLPKVLHRICGKPMVEWVVDAAREAGASRSSASCGPATASRRGCPRGSRSPSSTRGRAPARRCSPRATAVEPGPFVVLSGDHPLVTAEQIADLLEPAPRGRRRRHAPDHRAPDPAGYGRIVRDGDGEVERIVETKHAEQVPPEELAIREINLGTYVFEAPALFDALERVADQNGERFLTGAFPVLKADGARIATCTTDDLDIAHGVNDRAGLMEAEELAQRRMLEDHARARRDLPPPGHDQRGGGRGRSASTR